jgi:hypoxanthine-guanine phosphoribosyltransferase
MDGDTADENSLRLYRTPWPTDFPDVIVHSDLNIRNAHTCYLPAKSGNEDAANKLACDLFDLAALEKIKELIKIHSAILCPVTALETAGFNAIPDAMAGLINDMEVTDHYIVQSNKVGHTKAKSFWRFVTPALFQGAVMPGRNYFLVDDHIGHGGTLANLRGFIEYHGGKVIGISTLTETRDARKIALDPELCAMVRLKHGQQLEDFWIDHFGYGLDCLTHVEAGFLYRQLSFDAIRAGLVEAAGEVRASGLAAIQIDD